MEQLARAASYDVSVVVPTYNRENLLARTLDSLLRQDAGEIRYEVLVVDNNSSDNTPALVAEYLKRWPHIRYFHEPRRGVSHARNTGISHARAEIVAFTDDDVEPDRTWIAAIKKAFDLHPEVDCIGGRIHARWPAKPPAWLTPDFWGALALQREHSGTPYVDAANASRCLATANFACHRAALLEVGGFSPEYLREEDRELQLRLWSAGKRGLYVDDMLVHTEVPPDRLTKAYHRRFYVCAGNARARMRYIDRIDPQGRLVPSLRSAMTLFGTPGFVYRDVLRHLGGWSWCVVTRQKDRAFFHETRLIYFATFTRTRYRQQGAPWRTAPTECLDIVRAAWNRYRRRRSSNTGPLARV